MTGVLLFCVAQEAKAFQALIDQLQHVHKIFAQDTPFYLVESREFPSDKSDLKTDLKDGEEFESAWIGASGEECQKWLRQNTGRVDFLETEILGIADERTARDGTILFQWFNEDLGENYDFEFLGYGVLPKEKDTWYSFRIDPKYAMSMYTALVSTEPDVIYPTYFGRKEDLTNDCGVFDVRQADRIICGHGSQSLE